ncbi:MAG: hypothetical protein LBT80_06795 [Lactobacillaceae bacterium]|nr:hypothetical protein [Lactobacillaceae bacterium]
MNKLKFVWYYSKKEIVSAILLLISQLVILKLAQGNFKVHIHDFETMLTSLQTIASIFVGFYGTMFGIVLTKEVMPIFKRLKMLSGGFNQYKWRVWESIIFSFIILFGSTVLQLINNYPYFVIIIWISIVFGYFISIIHTMWFFVSAVISTQDDLSS